ncbi:MAG TPA: hypothetical protein VN841_29660 [Bryobacteraceae bacterium]|nr:hypothetical protein [Bryobacteraceae bacterium]
MNHRIVLIVAVVAIAAACVFAQASGSAAKASGSIPRAADGHPDLSGIWQFAIDLPPTGLKKTGPSGVEFKTVDQSGRRAAKGVPGALPSTNAPSYKPELQAKVKDLIDHESRTDPVFYCGRPGVPRIGSPRKIVQTPKEMIFFYEDISGDPYRIIPVDGRAHRKDANPTYYGDSVGRWEGDTLVVDVTNFNEDGWFGEEGYFHSDAMHVVERLWRDGANLVYQYTVDDPKVLTAPWIAPPRVVKPSNEPLEESPKCVETDAAKLVNNDHHGQR